MNNASSLNIGFIQEELLKGEFKNLKKMFNGIPPYDIAILLESSSPNNSESDGSPKEEFIFFHCVFLRPSIS